MIVEQIVGNVRDSSTSLPHIERVYLESDELVKRVQRVVTDHGTELGIRLPENRELADGDILYQSETNMIIVAVKEDDLLVIRPVSLQQMGDIAHQLGNRHLPAQFEEEVMLMQYDYLVENLLIKVGVPYKREKRKVSKAFRYIGHSHE